MGLVSIKCPNCGGTVDFDEKRNYWICNHCEHKSIYEEPPSLQRINKRDRADIDKWIKIALTTREGYIAESYANRILDIDAQNGMGWYIKGCVAVLDIRRNQEARECWKKTCRYMTNEEKTNNMSRILYGICDYHVASILYELQQPNHRPSTIEHDVASLISDVVGIFDAPSVPTINFSAIEYDVKSTIFEIFMGFDDETTRVLCKQWHNNFKTAETLEKNVHRRQIISIVAKCLSTQA
jgi:DNA-directed RNA polymerase subunit RPC12/RpoP